MTAVLGTIALRLALCAGVTWLAWRFGGLTSAVGTIVLYAVALPRPLIDLASELRHQTRRAHWRDVEGRHFAYHGSPVSVHEDIDHRRWIRVRDVRTIVGFTSSDAALAVTYPNGWRLMGRPPEAHLREDALLAHLTKERSPATAKFCHWAEREIVFPARRQRERLGIRTTPADSAAID
ncbi:MAG: hypothetical protein ABIV63_19250 [Caldimonas sp.]